MVARLLSLRWRVYVGTLRRSVWQTIGAVVSVLYALGGGALLVLVGFVVGLEVDVTPETVVLGSALVLAWSVGPLVAFGVDDTFDPRRLAPFPVRPRELLLGTGLATLLGPGGLFTVLALLAVPAQWVSVPAVLPVAVLAAALTLVTCVLGARATTSAARPLVEGRRGRDLVLGVAVVGMVLVGPAAIALGSADIDLADVAGHLAPWLAWTPLGAALALPYDAWVGQWAAFAGHLAIAVATPLALLAWWRRTLAVALTRPPRASAGRGHGLGVLGRVPDSPLGAVLARCLVYWVRDPRYATSLVTIPVGIVVVALLAGDGPWLLLAGPIVAWTCGWAIAVDVALDASAFWAHVAAPLRWSADRWGRILAIGVPGLVLSLGTAAWSVARTGLTHAAPAVLGVTTATLLVSLGLASVVSALVVFPVVAPGDNPFAAQQGGSTAAMLSQMLGTAAVMVVLAPTGVLTVLAVTRGSWGLSVAALCVGLASGVAALVGGAHAGARRLEARGPELLARLRSFSG